MTHSVTPRIGLVIIGDEILSGKRQDRHLANANMLLRPRGLSVSWVKFLSDDAELLVEELQRSFASNDIVFCFGGIGATPDDRTRQSAALALNVSLEAHPEAVAEIEAQFGDEAYPQRVKMAEYPSGASIIPNFYNRVPGFSFNNHHFMPGFPMMAQPMMEWVLEHYYSHYMTTPTVELAIRLIDGQESEWIEFMDVFETQFPQLRLFSLPKIDENDRRFIELGVEGQSDDAEVGLNALIAEANRREHEWELLT